MRRKRRPQSLAHFSAVGEGIRTAVLFGGGIVVHHGVHVPRRHQKAQHGRNRLAACILAKERREYQVAGSKKQRKQHKADKNHLFLCKFHDINLFYFFV